MKQENIICILSTFLVILLVVYETNSTPQEEKEFIDTHNKARLKEGLPPFTYDQKLADFARKYASSRARDCALQHSDGPYGENLFWGNAAKSLKWTPKDAVTAWVKEQKYYNRKTNTCKPGKKCGHYTQIMWRDTKKVGCALTNCRGKSTYVVCEYDPPGNYEGLSPFDKHDPYIYSQA
ncbi:pathogenesis-related protein PRMS-like [Rutidosis leptorrhynchoides]|uniref:pathogenesis-related protein PRMS-like n=1 Tax=Rutidosis leptorrhynchoides TaxID=125765 RepID=UPI003A9A61C5